MHIQAGLRSVFRIRVLGLDIRVYSLGLRATARESWVRV